MEQTNRRLLRAHTVRTKKLAKAYAWLARAEANETCAAGMYYAHIAQAKAQIERLTEELARWESENQYE